MNQTEYRDSLTRIRASEEFKHRMVSLMRQTDQSDYSQEKINRTTIRPVRKLAIAFAVLIALVAGALTVNAIFDLSFLYEEILGERAAPFIQDINEVDESNGIRLTVDAAYAEKHAVVIFFTLTDTEGLGRINKIYDSLAQWYKAVYIEQDSQGTGGNGALIELSGSQSLNDIYKSPDGMSMSYMMEANNPSDGELLEQKLRLSLSLPVDVDSDGNRVSLEVSFRPSPDTLTRTVNVNIDYGYHHIDTIDISPRGIVFIGTAEYVPGPIDITSPPAIFPMIFTGEEDDVVFLSNEGQPLKLELSRVDGHYDGVENNEGNSIYMNYNDQFRGMIPENLAAIRLGGVEYSLVVD